MKKQFMLSFTLFSALVSAPIEARWLQEGPKHPNIDKVAREFNKKLLKLRLMFQKAKVK